MLKPRIAASVLVRDGIVVQSYGFERYLPVGKPAVAVEFLDRWGVDEILLIDIGASLEGVALDPRVVREACQRCFVPLTVGGGISSLSEVDLLFRAGADKVCLNRAARVQPELVGEIARRYGEQAVVVMIDVKRDATGRARLWDYHGRDYLSEDLTTTVRQLAARGAGEVMVQAVDRDGVGDGFDVELAQQIVASATIPVIFQGGAGCPQHFAELLQQAPVNAAAAGNFFHYTEHSVTVTKAHLLNTSAASVRLETQARYQDASLNQSGRLLKQADAVLEKMLYQRIEPEVI